MPRAASLVIVLLVAGLWSAPARASDTADFHAAVADSMRHYREAAFYLRTGNAGLAALELEALDGKWAALVERFGTQPPDAYSADGRWTRALGRITHDIRKGLDAAQAGDAKAAAKAIKPIRRVLGDLRRRNDVFVFSDCVDNANAAMDALYKFRRKPPDFKDPASVDAARAATAVAAHWYKACLDTAPARDRKDPQFTRIMESSLAAFDRIWPVLRDGDRERFISILRELRSWDRLLYLRFG